MLRDAYWGGVRYLEFGGGGQDAIAALGAFGEIVRSNPAVKAQVRGVSGCSAGGIVAALLVANKLDPQQTRDDIAAINWAEYTVGAMDAIGPRMGVVGPEAGRRMLGGVIERRCGSKDITAQQLYDQTALVLRVRAVQLESGKCVYLDHRSHGDVALIDLLWATAAVPLAHAPAVIKGLHYVDGGLTCNYSLDAFLAPGRTHGFRVTPSYRRVFGRAARALESPVTDVRRWRNLVTCCIGSSLSTPTPPSERQFTTELPGNGNLLRSMVLATSGPPIDELLAVGRTAQQQWGNRRLCYIVVAILLSEHIL